MSNPNAFHSVFPMAAGQGDESYSANSITQLRYADVTRSMLRDLIRRIFNERTMENSKVFRVVDTGCATGANTLIAVDTIVSNAIHCCHQLSLEIPDFHVSFSDLPCNDFNTLLRNLPPKISSNQINNNSNGEPNSSGSNLDLIPSNRAYFASVVAGSHHRRLFPSNTLNFCHSSMSLHWLSRVPPDIEDRNSPAWNGKHIFVSNQEIKLAYFKQFKEDLTSFLECRAQEMVVGGGLFITLSGRISSVEPLYTPLTRILEIALKEMVEQGIIEENVIQKINIPVYNPSVEELRKIVEEEGSFSIIDVQVEEIDAFGSEWKEMNVKEFERIAQRRARSVLGSFFKSHLREDRLVDELFARVGRRTVHAFHDRDEVCLASKKSYVLGVSLVA